MGRNRVLLYRRAEDGVWLPVLDEPRERETTRQSWERENNIILMLYSCVTGLETGVSVWYYVCVTYANYWTSVRVFTDTALTV